MAKSKIKNIEKVQKSLTGGEWSSIMGLFKRIRDQRKDIHFTFGYYSMTDELVVSTLVNNETDVTALYLSGPKFDKKEWQDLHDKLVDLVYDNEKGVG